MMLGEFIPQHQPHPNMQILTAEQQLNVAWIEHLEGREKSAFEKLHSAVALLIVDRKPAPISSPMAELLTETKAHLFSIRAKLSSNAAKSTLPQTEYLLRRINETLHTLKQ